MCVAADRLKKLARSVDSPRSYWAAQVSVL
jgi:hypothetical protein